MTTIHCYTDSALWRRVLGAGCALAALLAPLTAQAEDGAEPPADRAADQPGERTFHRQESPAIVVTGALRNPRQDMLSGVAVVQGTELVDHVR